MLTPRPEGAPQAQMARAGGSRTPTRRPGTGRREFTTKVAGLETHTFNIGHAKYTAKFKKSLEEIANYVQESTREDRTWARHSGTSSFRPSRCQC